jgi:hypothetical protein
MEPTSEPEPDLLVLAKPAWEYPKLNPQPGDLRLVVEPLAPPAGEFRVGDVFHE